MDDGHIRKVFQNVHTAAKRQRLEGVGALVIVEGIAHQYIALGGQCDGGELADLHGYFDACPLHRHIVGFAGGAIDGNGHGGAHILGFYIEGQNQGLLSIPLAFVAKGQVFVGGQGFGGGVEAVTGGLGGGREFCVHIGHLSNVGVSFQIGHRVGELVNGGVAIGQNFCHGNVQRLLGAAHKQGKAMGSGGAAAGGNVVLCPVVVNCVISKAHRGHRVGAGIAVAPNGRLEGGFRAGYTTSDDEVQHHILPCFQIVFQSIAHALVEILELAVFIVAICGFGLGGQIVRKQTCAIGDPGDGETCAIVALHAIPQRVPVHNGASLHRVVGEVHGLIGQLADGRGAVVDHFHKGKVYLACFVGNEEDKAVGSGRPGGDGDVILRPGRIKLQLVRRNVAGRGAVIGAGAGTVFPQCHKDLGAVGAAGNEVDQHIVTGLYSACKTQLGAVCGILVLQLAVLLVAVRADGLHLHILGKQTCAGCHLGTGNAAIDGAFIIEILPGDHGAAIQSLQRFGNGRLCGRNG